MFSRQPKVAPVNHFTLGLFTDRKNSFSHPFVHFRLFPVPYFFRKIVEIEPFALRAAMLDEGQN